MMEHLRQLFSRCILRCRKPTCACCNSPCCKICRARLKIVGRKFIALLFSHVGLCALVAGYAIIGAFMFRAIELPYELDRLGHVKNETEEIMHAIIRYTKSLDALEYDQFQKFAEKLLKDFEKKIVEAVTLEGYDGDDDNLKIQWTFSGALLYSFTVITTIGYGHIAPRSSEGRMVTILYATIGIPLMLMCLANIAESLAQMFTFIYFRICCAYCRWKEKRHLKLRRAATVTARNYFGPTSLKRGQSMKSMSSKVASLPRRAGSFRNTANKKMSSAIPPIELRRQRQNEFKWDTRSLQNVKAPLKRFNTAIAVQSPNKSGTYPIRKNTASIRKTESMKMSSPTHFQNFQTAGESSTSSRSGTSSQPRHQSASYSGSAHKHVLTEISEQNQNAGMNRCLQEPSTSGYGSLRKACKCTVCWNPNIQDESPLSPENRLLAEGIALHSKLQRSRMTSAISTDDSSTFQISEDTPPSRATLVERLSGISGDSGGPVPQIVVSDSNQTTERELTGRSTLESGISFPPIVLPDEEDDSLQYADESSYRTQETMVMLNSEDRSVVTLASKRSADSDERSLRSLQKSRSIGGTVAEPDEKMPVSVGILTLIGFIIGGAILFALWEDWEVFDAAYFCFITLTTIGFGDLVPGKSMTAANQEIIIINALYLLIGMALIAMCFKLMQDGVVQKTRWLGQKIGILTKELSDDFYEFEDEDEFEEESEDENNSTIIEDKRTMSSGSSRRDEEDRKYGHHHSHHDRMRK